MGKAVQKLATSANGALSDDGGAVQIVWEKLANGGVPHVRLTWSEHHSPPIRQPDRRGFGRTVMVGIIEHDLGTNLGLTYAPSGVIWEMTAPAHRGSHASEAEATER